MLVKARCRFMRQGGPSSAVPTAEVISCHLVGLLRQALEKFTISGGYIMSDPTPCAKVLSDHAAGLPVDPADLRRCRRRLTLLQALMEILRGRILWWIPPPWPPNPYRNGPEELTTIPSVRDILINELLIDALKNPTFGRGLFDDLQLSDVYTEALRGFIDELDAVNKNMRAELQGLERK
jgi:hypothetical protein